MSQSIRDKWCEKEISDLDYIRHLEAENATLKDPDTCDGCADLGKFTDSFGEFSVCQVPLKNCSRRLVDHYRAKKQQ